MFITTTLQNKMYGSYLQQQRKQDIINSLADTVAERNPGHENKGCFVV